MILSSSQAKINLFFRVTSKRVDGYHEIASLYAKIDLHDDISISLSNSDIFSVNNGFVSLTDNLVIRARDFFRKKTKIKDKISIVLCKNIPIGSGLGGGSSNAATTLLILNRLFSEPLSLVELFEVGASLGSDVPFFLSKNKFAYCSGRGEIVESVCIPSLGPIWIASNREILLSTSSVYALCKPNALSSENPRTILDSYIKGEPIYINDLEPFAFKLEPKLIKIKEDLYSLGFNYVSMTGSGSSFICVGDISSPTLDCVDFHRVII